MRVSRTLAIAIAVVLGALLLGCSPRYQTFTSYTPPQDGAGRQCLAECSSTRQMCRQSGQTLVQQCRSQAQTEAQIETVRRLAQYHIQLERHGDTGQGAPELPGNRQPELR